MMEKKSLALMTLWLLGIETVHSMETRNQLVDEIHDAGLDLGSSWGVLTEDVQDSFKPSSNPKAYVSEILLARHPEKGSQNRIDVFTGGKPFKFDNQHFETVEKTPALTFPDMDEGESNEYPDPDLTVMVLQKHVMKGRYMWNIAADDMAWYHSEADIEKLLAEGKIREVRDSEKGLG